MGKDKKKVLRCTDSVKRVKGLLKEKQAVFSKVFSFNEDKPNSIRRCGMIKIPLGCLDTSRRFRKKHELTTRKPLTPMANPKEIAKEALRFALFAVLRNALRKCFEKESSINANRVTKVPYQKSFLVWRNKGALCSQKSDTARPFQNSHQVSLFEEDTLFDKKEAEEYVRWEDMIKSKPERHFQIGRITKYFSD